MRVVVPVVPESRHVAVVTAALAAAGVPYGVETVEGPDGYWKLLAGLWEGGDGFVVVEHDIVVGLETVWELIGCEHSWCAAPYPYMGGKGTIIGLGCTKFSGEIIAAVPDALERAGEMTDSHPAKHWCRLDSRIQRALVDSGYHVHFEHAPVEHLNPRGPSHGCRA
jgi:hypothetical protein